MSVRDRRGDVKVVEGSADDVDPTVLNSIDMRHVTVTRQRHGVRVVVRLKQVLPLSRSQFQQVGVVATAPGWKPDWAMAAFLTLQHIGGATAAFMEADGPDEPTLCKLTVAKGTKVVRLVIPERCLPGEAARVTVGSILIGLRGDEPFGAYDDLTIRGGFDLRPVVATTLASAGTAESAARSSSRTWRSWARP